VHEPDADAWDRVLLARFLAGEPEAFGEIVQRHSHRLWPVALRLCGGRAVEAEDAMQDAYLSAMRSAAGFRGEAKVSTWLYRIVVNASLDRIRRSSRRPEAELPDEALAVADPRDRYSEREVAWELERALARLPLEQRAVLVLVDVQGWPVGEAADALGVPVGTVKSRAARGRAKLAQDLAHLRNRPPTGDVEHDVRQRGEVSDGRREP
jgi:RNA polymerase sigma-70 factor (ECF subfamily)